MTLRWHGERVTREVAAHVRQNLHRAAIVVSRAARRNARTGGPAGLRRRSGRLLNSIGEEVDDARFLARVGSNLKYAATHEEGRTISAKPGRALAVPIHPAARRARGPREFGDLVMIKRAGRPPLLVRTTGKRTRRMDVMYVLMKSVKIPKRPFLRPALQNNLSRVRRELARPMPGGG